MNPEVVFNVNITEDLVKLRNELKAQAFSTDGTVTDSKLAEVVLRLIRYLSKGTLVKHRS